MRRSRYMVSVAGFTYRTWLSKSAAYKIRRNLIGCVNKIKVTKMLEVIG